MNKKVKNLILLFALIFPIVACSKKEEDKPNNGIQEPSSNLKHRYTYTITGGGINSETFTLEIPLNEHGGGLSYFDQANNYVMVSVMHNNKTPGIRVNFVYLNDVIQPLSVNELTNQNTSVIFLNFNYQGQNYTLESVSGTCVSYKVETFPFGLDSGKSSFKIGFTGTFRNILDHSQLFDVSNGEIEVHNN